MVEQNPFWDYSIQIYQQPGVEFECLHFQQQFGGNVNLLLFCCWLGEQGVCLEHHHIQELKSCIRFWDAEIIVEIRQCRFMVRRVNNRQLYNQFKQLELFTEQILQNALYQWYCEKNLRILKCSQIQKNIHMYAGQLCSLSSCLSKVLQAAQDDKR